MATVIAFLLAERIGILSMTASARGRNFIVRNRFLHPNTISFVRMPMGVLTVMLWVLEYRALAFLWFAAWMITDLTDGTIARRCGLQTESGIWLDPLSDKCMYFPPLIYLAFFQSPAALSPVWVALLLLIDAFGQGSRLLVRKKAANLFGKAKTALITILLTLAALHQMNSLPPLFDPVLLEWVTVSCALLAFLSLYCKVIPDNWYANSLTLANFLCGLAAIWQIYADHPVRGFVLVFVGQFFDLFDGRLARKFGSTPHGAVFDDIADGTSFGAAIGFMVVHELGNDLLCWLVAGLYVGCVVYRLIRFIHPTVTLPPGVFQGLPSPAGAMLAGSSVLLFPDMPGIGMAFVLVAAFLMISSIPYQHFGQKIWPALPNSVKLLVFISCLMLANIGIADKNYRGGVAMFCFGLTFAYLLGGTNYRRKTPPASPAS